VSGEEITVWRAWFNASGLHTTSFPATRTAKRVAVHGSGSFRSDEYFSPDSVNLTERDAVAKLLLVVKRDRDHAQYLFDQAAEQERWILAKLEELA
jgi:hypothetical protein